MSRILGALVVSVVSTSCKHAPPAQPPVKTVEAPARPVDKPSERLDKLETGLLPSLTIEGVELGMKIDARMAFYKTPAVGVAVVDGDSIEARSWGVRQAEKRDRVDTDTRFQFASISKPVTAVAIMKLVEKGRLDLDKPVETYIKTWKIPASPRPITLRRLLSHTAGFNAPEQVAYVKPDGTLAGYAPKAPLPTTLQILNGAPPAITSKIELLSPIPDGFMYSGGGYMVLQLVIEEATNKPFAAAMKDLVFDPVGMTHSTFEADPGTDNVARAHAVDGSVVPGGWYAVAEKSIGGLWSTPRDMAMLLQHLIAASRGQEGKILSPSTMKTMLTGITSGRPASGGFIALGLFVQKPDAKTGPWFTHNGHNPGYHATLTAAPADGKGMIVVVDREGSTISGEVMSGISKLYGFPGNVFGPPIMKQFTMTPEQLAQCAGAYDGPGFRIELRADKDKLFGRLGGPASEEKQLYPIAPYKLVEPYAGALVELTLDGQRITTMQIKGSFGVYEARRAP